MTEQERSEFLKRLGLQIRALREQKDMSLDTLAEKAGYTSDNRRSSIQKIESGKTDLPAYKLMLIANALDTTAGNLICGIDAPTEPPEQAGGVNFDTTSRNFTTTSIQLSYDSDDDIDALFIEKYGQEVYDAAMEFVKLDHDDQIRILERAGIMLEDDKYKDGLLEVI